MENKNCMDVDEDMDVDLYNVIDNPYNELIKKLKFSVPPTNERISLNDESLQLLKQSDDRGDTLLIKNAENGHLKCVDIIIRCVTLTEINHKNKKGKSAIDISWDEEFYDVVLLLLLADSNFPDKFDISDFDKGNVFKQQIMKLANWRNSLHKLISAPDESVEEIKQSITEGKKIVQEAVKLLNSKESYLSTEYYKPQLFLNADSKSANCTAIENEKFNIYSFLTSIGACFLEEELVCTTDLCLHERCKIKVALLPYFKQIDNSHIYYLMSKSRSFEFEDSFETKMKESYCFLNKIPEISAIMKVVATSDFCDIIFDFVNTLTSEIDPSQCGATYGHTNYFEQRIYVAGGSESLAILAHELTHLAMFVMFENKGYPYSNNDDERENFFTQLMQQVNFRLDNLLDCHNTATADMRDILFTALKYPETEHHKEIIARSIQIIAKYGDEGKEWLSQFPELLEFLDYLTTNCDSFTRKRILIKPNKSMKLIDKFVGLTKELHENDGILNENTDKYDVSSVTIPITFYSVKDVFLVCLLMLRSLQKTEKYSEKYYFFTFIHCIMYQKDIITAFYSEDVKLLVIADRVEKDHNRDYTTKETYQMLKEFINLAIRYPEKKIIFIIQTENLYTFIKLLTDLKVKFYQQCDVYGNEFFNLKYSSDSINIIQGKKKIISEKHVQLFENLFNQIFTTITCEQNSFNFRNAELTFNILSTEKQNKIIHRGNLKFQGNVMSLGKLLNINDVEKLPNIHLELLDKMLTKDIKRFIMGQNVVVDKKVFKWRRNFRYISRKFYKIEIKKSIENDQEFYNKFRYTKESFDELRRRFPEADSHWIKNQSKKLIWQQSNGSISSLREYVEAKQNVSTYFSELHLLKHCTGQKIIVISDTAEMGKSIVLTKLAQKLKEGHMTCWILKINLSDHTKLLKQFRDKEPQNEFFYQLFSLKTNFKKKLFDSHRIKMVIMFDGFDEICPHYKEIVTRSIKCLIKTKKAKQIWITTREIMKQYLEDEFKVFSFALKPFSNEEQIEILTSIWKERVSETSDKSTFKRKWRSELKLYAEELIKELTKLTSIKSKEFLGMPLHIMMVSEIFYDNEGDLKSNWQSCKTFISIDCKNKNPQLEVNLDVLDLYDKFLKKKIYESHCQGKLKMELSNPTSVHEDVFENRFTLYKTLALYKMFSGVDDCKFLYEYGPDIEKILNRVKDGKENIGIIDGLINNKPNFIHLTFAEYLASFLVAEKLIDSKLELPIMACIDKILPLTSTVFLNSIIKNFKDSKRSSKLHKETTILSRFVQKGFLSFVKGVVEMKFEKWLKPDVLKKTPMHYAAQCGYFEILEYLLNYYNNIPDKSVFEPENFKIDKYLISNLKSFVDDKDNECKTALCYAVENEPIDTDKLLKSILNVVNQNTSLTDHERLELLEKILQNIFTNIQEAKANFYNILETAARFGHIKTFEKFTSIHYSEEENYQHLIAAFKYCQFSIVKYLLSKLKIKYKNEGTALHVAVSSKTNLEIMSYVVKAINNINAVNGSGETPLMLAIKIKNRGNLIQFLIEHGANINITFDYSNDDTYYYLNLLLESGAHFCDDKMFICDKNVHELFKNQNLNSSDLNSVVQSNPEDLFTAIQRQNFNWCKFILHQIHNIDLTDKSGKTPMHFACKVKVDKIVKLLLQNGAIFDKTDKSGSKPLDELYDLEGSNLITCLLRKLDKFHNSNSKLPSKTQLSSFESLKETDNLLLCLLNARNSCNKTLLHAVAERNQAGIFNEILDLNAEFSKNKLRYDYPKDGYSFYAHYKSLSLDAVDSEGNTPLHIAAKKGNRNIVENLLKSGAIFNIKNKEGKIPEGLAEDAKNENCKKHLNLVRIQFENFLSISSVQLKKKSVYINPKNEKKESLLHFAVSSQNPQIFKLLLEKDIDINSQDIEGFTPLHIAVKNDDITKVKLLLLKGAIFDIKNEEGKTPLNLARNKIKRILLLIKELFNTILNDTPQGIIEELKGFQNEDVSEIPLSVIINARNEWGNSVLHYAAEFGYISIVNYLLESGAIYDCENIIGDTPQTLANCPVIKHKLESVELLLNKEIITIDYFHKAKEQLGFKVVTNVRNIKGMTLLHLAAIEGNEILISDLLESGADVNAIDNCDQHALHYAKKNHHDIVVKILQSHMPRKGRKRKRQNKLGVKNFAPSASKAQKKMTDYFEVQPLQGRC